MATPEDVEAQPKMLRSKREDTAVPEVTQKTRLGRSNMLLIVDMIENFLRLVAREYHRSTGSPVTTQAFDFVRGTVQEIAQKVAQDFNSLDTPQSHYFLAEGVRHANQELHQTNACPEIEQFFDTVNTAFQWAAEGLDQRAISIGTQSPSDTLHETVQMDVQEVNEAATSSATQKPVNTVKQISSTMDSATE
jgi:hypothetical protein